MFDNGAAALDAALAQEVAIILLDVDMPGLDGYTVCRRLREVPRLASVPIVMVTGHEDTSAIDRAFNAGATDYISKPVNWALLPHRLAYILRNAASVRALADRESKVRTLSKPFRMCYGWCRLTASRVGVRTSARQAVSGRRTRSRHGRFTRSCQESSAEGAGGDSPDRPGRAAP